MADPTERNPSIKVKDLISAFEHQTQDQEYNDYYEDTDIRPKKLKRTKSVGSALSYKLFRQPKSELYDILDIEKEIVRIETHLNYYELYDKETHVAFQEQLFDILSDIVNIDTQGEANAIQKKKHLIEETQNLARILNGKLPVDSNTRKVTRTFHTITVKKQEPILSNGSKHFANVSSGHNIVQDNNNTVKKSDLTEVSEPKTVLKEPSNEEMNHLQNEEISNTKAKSVSEDIGSGFLPSVKKLKAFFSFSRSPEREDLIKIKSTNVSRSKSMHCKSKYNVDKKLESDDIQNNIQVNQNETGDDKLQPQSNEEQVVTVEPIEEITTEVEVTHSISVNELKKLFEEEKAKTSHGFEVLSSTLPIQQTELGIAVTSINLGAFRLKRSLSGQYMNQVGLLTRKPDTRNSVDDLTSLAKKDSLVINKFGNIENDIDDDEEEKMPSLDYNSGMPSIGYDLNIPEPIREKGDETITENQVSKPQTEVYNEVTEITVQPLGTKKSKIEDKTHELMDILHSTKSLSKCSTTEINSSSTSALKEVITSGPNLSLETEVTEATLTHQNSHVTRVTSHKVHNLVTSFERQNSIGEQNVSITTNISKENKIPIPTSPTSHHIVQSIISSIEKKELDSPTQIVEEPESLPYLVDAENSGAKRLSDHGVTISEIPSTPEITENNLNEAQNFQYSASQNIAVVENLQSTLENAVLESEHNLNTNHIISHTHTMSHGVIIHENSTDIDDTNSKPNSTIAVNGHQESKINGNNVDEQQEQNSSCDNSENESFVRINSPESPESVRINSENSINGPSEPTKLTETSSTTVVAKTNIIVDKSLAEDLFEEAVLDVENVDEEFEKILVETIK